MHQHETNPVSDNYKEFDVASADGGIKQQLLKSADMRVKGVW